MGSLKRCELCSKGAALNCEADSAYLCWGCDAKVHGANFLVARHVRIVLCCRCHEYTDISICALCPGLDQCLCSGCLNSECSDETSLRISTTESGISGCGFCSPCKTTKDGVIASGLKKCFCTKDKEDHRLLEASTNRVLKVSIDELSWSYSEHATSLDSQFKGQEKKHMITRHAGVVQYSDMKVEAILRRWYRYLNLRNPSTVPLAMHLVEKGSHKLGRLFRQRWRICVAAALWLAASLCEKKAHLPSMKKVEECTGVPSKLILVVESRLAKISDWKMHEEGCAESDTVSPS